MTMSINANNDGASAKTAVNGAGNGKKVAPQAAAGAAAENDLMMQAFLNDGGDSPAKKPSPETFDAGAADSDISASPYPSEPITDEEQLHAIRRFREAESPVSPSRQNLYEGTAAAIAAGARARRLPRHALPDSAPLAVRARGAR